MVEIDEVGTDPVRLTGMPATHRQFMQDSWLGYFGQMKVEPQPAGVLGGDRRADDAGGMADDEGHLFRRAE